MLGKTKRKNNQDVARWLLANMDPEELERLLLRGDAPLELWHLLEGGNGSPGIAEPVTGPSPYNA